MTTQRYLFDIVINQNGTRELVDSIAREYNLSIAPGPNVGGICNSIYVTGLNALGKVYLSEFPGNCSALVVSGIQVFAMSKDRLIPYLDFSVAVCKKLQYALLFATGTNKIFHSYLKEYGFEDVLTEVYNEHSGSRNFFCVLRINVEEDEQEEA